MQTLPNAIRDAYLPSLGTIYQLVCFDTTAILGFPFLQQALLANPNPQSFPNGTLLPLAITNLLQTQSTTKKDIDTRCPSLPKLPFYRKNAPEGYFAAKTGKFNLFPRLIPKQNYQFQSSPTQSPYISILLKPDSSSWARTMVYVVTDWGFHKILRYY